MKTREEITACIERQKELCKGGFPMFAPDDGICWTCRRQIYQDPTTDGSILVTGCPFCHRSYCD